MKELLVNETLLTQYDNVQLNMKKELLVLQQKLDSNEEKNRSVDEVKSKLILQLNEMEKNN